MSVQFILGRSGTGKTSYCISSIVEALLEPDDNKPLILLVPEQATYQAELAILGDERLTGYSSGSTCEYHNRQIHREKAEAVPRLNVLSFDRLQFLLSGKKTARPTISRIGRQMIVQKVLRDNSSNLKVLGPCSNHPGLGQQIAQTISELHQYAKTPDDIDQLLAQLQKDEHNNLTALKLSDVSLVLKEYLRFIEGIFIDPEIQLAETCKAAAEAGFIKEARLWVDGFAGFTTTELAILAELLKAAANSQIALCLDPSRIDLSNPDADKLDTVDLFSPTQRTYTELIELIKRCKLQLAEPKLLQSPLRFSDCPQIAHIERNIFEPEPEKIPAAENVRIVSAPDARAEVRFVAREILKLVKDKDCRYRDIAVIASDIDTYQHYIKAYFDDYGIPFFIDKRKPLNQHPIVQLICSALKVVTEDFSYGDIFAYLKTDLVPIERNEVDILENYCLAFGVTGSDWQSSKDWHFAAFDDEDFDEKFINQIRSKVTGHLITLRDKLCPDGDLEQAINSKEFTKAVFDFIDRLNVREKIGDWINEADKKNEQPAIEEHQQFFNRFVDVFDELVEVFSGHKMRCRDYISIINFAFSQLSLALIPPALDQVLIGSIERSRHPDLKAAFLIGTTQRQFPVSVSYNRLLNDQDRKVFDKADFQLAPSTNQTLVESQYLAYIAFTRPSQFLYLTYPLNDEKGRAISYSPFITELKSLFENLSEESVGEQQFNIEKVKSEFELADLLCERLGRESLFSETGGDEEYSKLLNEIRSDKQLSEIGSTVTAAIEYENLAKLDKEITGNLFGRQIKSSATRLRTFATCPYQHFARYILELEQRREFKFRPLDVGDFYHRVLDSLLKKLNQTKKDFATIQDEELLELLSQQISKICREDSFISNFAAHSPHNLFIIQSAGENIEACVQAIAKMVRAGAFRPILSEVPFGRSDDILGEYRITLSNGRLLVLSGKIDRLDIADINGEKTALIFDYKKRGDTFSWSQFYYGLDIQLPIYMLAVRNSSNRQYNFQNVAGAFYMPVEVSPKSAQLDEISEKTDSFDYKAKGIFNGEFAQQLDENAYKDSKFYNFYVKKSGEPYGSYETRGALKPGDFEKVLRFTEREIAESAEQILRGNIDVKPYRLGTQSPCSNCIYKPLCRFDWQINDCSFLESLDKSQVLEKI